MADVVGRCSSSSVDRRSHFLVVAAGYQGHLNPAISLARRLACANGGGSARVTLSVAVSAHARMFPSPPAPGQQLVVVSPPDVEASDGVISYVPYTDGFDFGARPTTAADRARRHRVTAASLSAILRRLAAAGRPVTCVVSALMVPAADVALEHGIPLVVFCNQSAATLAAYYHYFHGHGHLVAAAAAGDVDEASVTLPGLPPLRVRELPSFLMDAATGDELARASVDSLRPLFEIVGREKPVVLVNTTDVLEPEAVALRSMREQHLEVLAVGPMLPRLKLQQQTTDDAPAAAGDEGRRIDLYEQDDEKIYMEWLDARPRRSVVYVSYGSMLGYTRQQVKEMLRGLRECRRPYLWVVPKDGRDGEVERCLTEMNDDGDREEGMVVEWCDQLKVLAHPSTGCFVTHCGWNSTLEALVYGVPMVAVPNWSDQPVNAHLVEELGVGVRAERDAAGLLVGAELASCIAVVTGDGDEGMSIRNRASFFKDKVRKEVIETGLPEFRLQKFICEMQNSM